MVKAKSIFPNSFIFYSFIFYFLFLISYLFTGCDIDFGGIVYSTDINKRLNERNSFIYLSDADRNPLFGSSYSFIVLSDIHIEDGKTKGFENIQTAVNNNSNVKFIVVTGDITHYGDRKDYDAFLKTANSLTVPCYPVIGNHDIYFSNWDNWKQKIGSTNYKIDADTATLFILDSANGFFGKEQLDRLEYDLSFSKRDVFVFTHSNLFADGFINPQQTANINERARIVSMLNGKADLMFMGHSHKRQINKIGGVDYIVTEDFERSKTYCLVTVSNSTVTYKFNKL